MLKLAPRIGSTRWLVKTARSGIAVIRYTTARIIIEGPCHRLLLDRFRCNRANPVEDEIHQNAWISPNYIVWDSSSERIDPNVALLSPLWAANAT